MLRAGMVERFKKAMPVLKEMVQDFEWLQDEFDPKTATEEERAYAKHLMMLGCNSFDEADWRLTRMFKAVGKTGYLVTQTSHLKNIKKLNSTAVTQLLTFQTGRQN